jgi:tRNA uridine 5-carbamoylmethylation protein Kti12
MEMELRGEDFSWCSADHYFELNGHYNFDPTKLNEAHSSCFRRVLGALNPSAPHRYVIVDNCNSQKWEMSPYVVLAKALGAEHLILEFQSDLDLCAERNIHSVKKEKIEKILKGWERPLKTWNHKFYNETSWREDVL